MRTTNAPAKTMGGRARTMPAKPSTARNQKRLSASCPNLVQGTDTSALSSATQCRNMNLPRLLNHRISSHKASRRITADAATGTIQTRLFSTYSRAWK